MTGAIMGLQEENARLLKALQAVSSQLVLAEDQVNEGKTLAAAADVRARAAQDALHQLKFLTASTSTAPPKRTSSTEEEAAATKMQAAMRGTWGRKEASERMQQELTALEVEDQYERLRVQLTEALATQEALIAFHDAERKTWAAERIRLGGEEVQALSASALEAIKEERVAIKMQTRWRCRQARRRMVLESLVQQMGRCGPDKRLPLTEETVAIKLQTRWRSRQARRRMVMESLMQQMGDTSDGEPLSRTEVGMVAMMQSRWRSKMARRDAIMQSMMGMSFE